MSNDLNVLFERARQYGRVYLYTADDGTYSVSITFTTIKNTSLKAESGFRHVTPQEAFTAAIAAAENIVATFAATERKRLT